MSADVTAPIVPAQKPTAWIPLIVVIAGIAIPIAVTIFLGSLFPGWHWVSLPFHSTLEVAGAILGLMLVILILFTQQNACTSRKMWIACALISMAVLDIFHSCVPAGVSFVWLHSLAVLGGGFFFALIWFPEKKISWETALTASGAVLLVTVLIGVFSLVYPKSLPAVLKEGSFTPAADAINLIGGGLIILAAINFAARYYRKRDPKEKHLMILCLFFGISGVIFNMSATWKAGWWFWHVLRFAGYSFAFWLTMLAYRSSENEMLRAHSELDSLFQVAADGKRFVDRQFNQTRSNDTFVTMSGIARETADQMKCYEVLPGPQCSTEQCPIKQFEMGSSEKIYQEVIKTRRDGREISCILTAIRLNASDGSFRGIMESLWDITDLKDAERELKQQNQAKTGQAELSDLMRGEQRIDDLCRNIITFLCKYLDARTGLIYLANHEEELTLVASYAHKHRKHLANKYKPGEGLIGQAALEKEDIVFANVPDDYIIIESGLGETAPRNIYVKPIVQNGKVKAVIELGTLHGFNDFQSQFLNMVTEGIAVAIESSQSRTSLSEALERSQQLAEELQTQQEELKVSNEELEEKTRKLQASESELKNQQEELQVINEELEEKTRKLEEQREMVMGKNRELQSAQEDLERKARDLEITGKYKSEFLANMSHELRTPLNSLLILAQDLAANKKENLDADQLDSARIIHKSGQDLLNLINEILDLSKIEAGRMTIHAAPVIPARLVKGIVEEFRPLVEEKGLSLITRVSPDLPETIHADEQRLGQILKNLVSNAVKFTQEGSVILDIFGPQRETDLSRSGLDPGETVAFSVTDTGIGIHENKQMEIFEAFQQADGGTARSHQGTGLGLSISRELARLMGGEIQVQSEKGKGSAFTLYLPKDGRALKPEIHDIKPETRDEIIFGARPQVSDIRTTSAIADDRENIGEDDRIILVIEDDLEFARILHRLCHERNFKCLHAPNGETGLAMIRQYKPDAVILDIRLPGIKGWEVLESIKNDSLARHIPVHMISVEEETLDACRKGAIGYLTKPVSGQELEGAFSRIEDILDRKLKRLLIIEDDEVLRAHLMDLIGNGDVETTAVGTGAEGLEQLSSQSYDCVILDLNLPDISGFEILERLDGPEGNAVPPIIVYTGRDLTWEEDQALQKYASSIIVKGVRSQERLLDETALFLHRIIDRLPAKKKKMISKIREGDEIFKGKKVLVADDDMRNVYALSRVLEDKEMTVFKAVDGEKALEIIEQTPDMDLVLMDIMMPEMDGYEAIRRIRAQNRFKTLPILAVTAKAMKEDRAKCITAGANDYLSKPVDVERLLSLMRVWLYK